MSLGLFAGLGWAGTFALFSDDAKATSTFTAGTLDLQVNSEVDDDYAFSALSVANMVPGDVQYAPLTMSNAGNNAFRYTMASTLAAGSDTTLDGALDLQVRKAATAGDCGAGLWDPLLLDPAVVVGKSDPSKAAITTARTLAVGANEVLCFRIELPSTTDNTVQGKSVTATFGFTASQITS